MLFACTLVSCVSNIKLKYRTYLSYTNIIMKGSRPEQAVLSRDTDMSKTEETRRVIEGMVDGLNDHRIADIGEFFAGGFRWMGNFGCGTKSGVKEFQENWQKPFQAAFSDKVCVDEARLYMGEWAAAFGRQEARVAIQLD